MYKFEEDKAVKLTFDNYDSENSVCGVLIFMWFGYQDFMVKKQKYVSIVKIMKKKIFFKEIKMHVDNLIL